MRAEMCSVVVQLFGDGSSRQNLETLRCKGAGQPEACVAHWPSERILRPGRGAAASSFLCRSQRRQVASAWWCTDESGVFGAQHVPAASSWPPPLRRAATESGRAATPTSFQYGGFGGFGGGGGHGGGGGYGGGQNQGGAPGQGGQMQGGQAQGGYDGGGTNPIPFTTQKGQQVMVNGTSEDLCIESCKNAPQLKNESLGAMAMLTGGGEMQEIADCIRFCKSEFGMTCFPGDAVVHVRNRGRLSLADLQVGDEVLCYVPSQISAPSRPPAGSHLVQRCRMQAAEAEGRALNPAGVVATESTADDLTLHGWSVRFDAVVAWLHWEPDAWAEVFEIRHSLGKVRLTSNHFIFVQRRSAGPVSVILAKQVHLGDRLLAPWLDGGIAGSEVLGIERVRSKGLYAPLLSSGTIVVDNTLASCYAAPENLFAAPGSTLSWIVEAAGGWQNLAHMTLKPLVLTATLSTDVLRQRCLSMFVAAASATIVAASTAIQDPSDCPARGGGRVLAAVPRGGVGDKVGPPKLASKHSVDMQPPGLVGGVNQYCWVLYVLCSALLT